jgi:hypothetical protein
MGRLGPVPHGFLGGRCAGFANFVVLQGVFYVVYYRGKVYGVRGQYLFRL